MKQLFKNRTFLTALIALVLVLGISAKSAMAYFTTYVKAQGGYTLTLGENSEIEEKVKDMTKSISIKNTGEQPEFVRVKVFYGSATGVTVTYNPSSGWSQGDDGYWYYDQALEVDESTSILEVKIEADSEKTSSFNVVVIQECTGITPEGTADWTHIEKHVEDENDVGGGE